MNTFRISFISVTSIIIFLCSISGLSQTKTALLKSSRYNFTVVLGYDYAFANANGDVNGFSTFYSEKGNVF
jgi:hypothetical protein